MISDLHALTEVYSWQQRLAATAALTLLQAAVLQAAAPRRPATRLAAVAPVVLSNMFAPFLFRRDTESVSLTFTAFFLTWLGNFKAAALAAGRGPLAQQPWLLVQLWVLYALPILPAVKARPGARQDSPGPPLLLLLRWLLKTAVTAAIVFFLAQPGLPLFVKSCLYCLGLYSMLGVAMDGPAALLLRPLRLSLAPHFRSPWESISIADFWGFRWNQAASNALRTTIYDPIVQGSWVSPELSLTTRGSSTGGSTGLRRSTRRAGAAVPEAGSDSGRGGGGRGGGSGLQRRRLLGMFACFLASGAVHELIFWYVQGGPTPCWAWLIFFTGQAPLVAAERQLLTWLQERGQLPRMAVRRIATLAVLLLAGHFLFFLPAEISGVPARFAASMRHTFAAAAAAPGRLLGSAAAAQR